jgi:hypothetical protein
MFRIFQTVNDMLYAWLPETIAGLMFIKPYKYAEQSNMGSILSNI